MGKGEIARHNVFKSCQLLMRQNEYLCSKELSWLKVFYVENIPNDKPLFTVTVIMYYW